MAVIFLTVFQTSQAQATLKEISGGSLPGGEINGDVTWYLTGTLPNGNVDYLLTHPITVKTGSSLTITNTAHRYLKILQDTNDGETPFTVEQGAKLTIQGNDSGSIIFDGENNFEMDSISSASGGRYFLNCKGGNLPNIWDGKVTQHNVYCAHTVKNFIYSQGQLDLQKVYIHDYHSNEGLIVIQVSPTEAELELKLKQRTIARFKSVSWRRNRCYNSQVAKNKNAFYGGTCILIRNVEDKYRDCLDPELFKVEIDDCEFTENSMGGASLRTYGYSRCNIYLSNSVFCRNYSSYDAGGAIHWNANSNKEGKQPKLTISNCTFYRNQAESHGGAIFSQGNMFFDDNPKTETVICDNTAGAWDNRDLNNTGRGGGGIRISGYPYENETSHLYYDFPSNLIIKENKAEYGAGILIHYTSTIALPEGTTIDLNLRSKLYENKAFGTTYYGGGGLGVLDTSNKNLNFNIHLSGTEITGNEARLGGGVYVENCNIIFDNDKTSIISNNSSYILQDVANTGNGGGIYLYNGYITCKRSNITGNVAENNGGGIYISGTKEKGSIMDYYQGKISGNYSNNMGGGIYVGDYGAMRFQSASSVGIYNNIAETAGDEISKHGYGSVSLPQTTYMRVPDVLKSAYWIEDTKTKRYRRDHNDVVTGGKFQANEACDVALGFVDFSLGIKGTPSSTFMRDKLQNQYSNHIAWPFSKNALQLSGGEIEVGSKLTLWRSTTDYNSIDQSNGSEGDNPDIVTPQSVANIIITEMPEGDDYYGVPQGDVKALVLYNDGRQEDATFRIGTLNDDRRVFLPANGDDDCFYTFTDTFLSGTTAGNEHPDKYYYRLSFLPATSYQDTKDLYAGNTVPVSYSDDQCFHSDQVCFAIPKANLSMRHNDYSFEEIDADGVDNNWLDPNSALFSSSMLTSGMYDANPSQYNVYQLYKAPSDPELEFSGLTDSYSFSAFGEDIQHDFSSGYYVLEMRYTGEDGTVNTYGSNLAKLKSLPSLEGQSIEMTNDNGFCQTASVWALTPGEYTPAIYRLWSYDDELSDDLTPLNQHNIYPDPAARGNRVIAIPDDDSDITGFHPDQTFVTDNTLNVYHIHSHDNALPTESYRVRHYSVVDPQASDPRYVLSEATMTVKAQDNNTSGIDKISASDESTATPVYYNLSGIELPGRPTSKGVYIIRRGNTVTKELIE